MNKKRLLAIFMVCTFMVGVFSVQSKATENPAIETIKEIETLETKESETETEDETQTQTELESVIETESETELESVIETESETELESDIETKEEIEIKADNITTVELNNDTNKLYYNLVGKLPFGYRNHPVEVKFESLDESVVTVDENGYFKTLTGGEAVVRITAGKRIKDIVIKVIAPSNIDYTINGKSPETVIANPTAKVQDENWYKEIVIKKDRKNIYTTLVYREKGTENWTKVDMTDDNAWIIDNNTVKSYEFYFEDASRNIVSNKILELNNVAVDNDSPTLSDNLTTDIEPSIYSTEEVAYFSEYVPIKIAQVEDTGSGVAKLIAIYKKNGDVVDSYEFTVMPADRYNSEYEIVLNDNKDYGKVEIIAEDYLGNRSQVASYEKEICVDTVNPVVTMDAMTMVSMSTDAESMYYNGEWTSKQLKFIISSLENTQVSGIHSYEYAIVPRGNNQEENETELEWIKLDKDNLSLKFGSDFPIDYAKLNATIYVRAESNAGLITTEEAIEKTKKEIRIWQQDLQEAIVNFDKKPDASTGWYNKQTGEVTISFEYPEYDEANIGPAVGIVYTFTTKTSEEGDANTINRCFYKGIINEESKKVIEVSDYTDESTTSSLENEGKILIDKDSINTITVYAEDAAGNKSQETEYEIKADFIAPDNLIATADGTELKIFSVESGEAATYVIFSQNPVDVRASAEYGISGRGSLQMSLTKNQESTGTDATDRNALTIEPCSRGLVYLRATDIAGNVTEAWTDGIVSDNQAPIGAGQTEFTIKTEGENYAGFYNKNIPLEIAINDSPSQDNYAGLKSVSYQVGRNIEQLSDEITLSSNSSKNLSWSQIESLFSYENKDLIIDATQNESNYATIKVTAIDNADNIAVSTKEIKIDVTAPTIDISFDNNKAQNQVFYNTPRTAKIDITELNFEPSLVELTIYRDGLIDTTLNSGLTSWTTSENNVHTSYITFNQDGDYYFEVKCKDLADNESQSVMSENFTIDMTTPIIDVSYDNNTQWNGNYYNQPRTATVTVTERNFNPNDFKAIIAPSGSIGTWVDNGDVHMTTIYFGEEVQYSYIINYTDLAGNQAGAYGPEEFIIDSTKPEITIKGVANQSANSGDISPIIYMSDEHFDENGTQISLVNSKGQIINVESQISRNENLYVYSLVNINSQPDEIYTLTASTTDMAGNNTEKMIRFSLNREGSVYDLSQISELSDKGYIRSDDLEDIHIKEMNISSIEDFILIVTKNDKAITGKKSDSRPSGKSNKSVYYSVSVVGNDDIGYEYDYTIYKEAFMDEGIYNVMFYSKDAAGNEVNNTLDEKDAKLSFIIDNSAPNVTVNGINEGWFKLDEPQEVNVYIKDNFKLAQGYFELIDEDGNLIKAYDYMELAEVDGEVVTITIPATDKYVSLGYYASDVAGNEIMLVQENRTAKAASISEAFIGNKNLPSVITGIMVCVIILLIGISIKMYLISKKGCR